MNLPPGILPDDPIVPFLEAMTERDARMEALTREFRDKLDGARGLTQEAEHDLVQRIAREVRVHLAAPRGSRFTRPPWLIAAGTVAALVIGGVAYVTGRTHGGDARVAALCQGAAIQPQAGGTACSFWLVPPARR